MGATDAKKTVVIELNAAGDIGSVLEKLAATFTDFSNAATGLNARLMPLLDALSKASMPDNFVKGVEAIKSLSGFNLPNMDNFAKGLEKLVGLDKKTTDLSALLTAVEGFKDLTVPGLLNFSKGLDALASSRDKVGDAASTIRGLHGSVKLFEGLSLPDLKNVADGIASLYKTVGATGGGAINATGISSVVDAVKGLDKLKMPPMNSFAEGMTKLRDFSDPDGKIKANIDQLKKSLEGLGKIELPGVSKFASGLKALAEIDVTKVITKIAELAKGMENLDKAGTLKSFATLANDLRSLTTNLQSNVTPLNQLKEGFDRVSKSTQSAGVEVKGFGDRLMNYIQYRVVADTVMKLESAFGTAIDVIREYDQSLKDLQAITSATDTQVGMMGKVIIDVAENTKFSASQVAEGMKILGQAGFSASESIQTIRAVSDLATGTLSSMKETVDLVTTALRVFDINTANSSHVADVFATAVNKSKLNIEMLRTAFNYVGPVAKDAGVSFEESAASLMVLANSGLRASTAGTGLRLLFSDLVDPPKKFKTAVEAAGMTMDQFDPKTLGLARVLTNLNLVITDAGMAFDIFGKRGAAAVMTLKDSSNFGMMLASLNSSGSAANMAAIQMEGLGVMIKNLKDKVELLAISLGKAGITDVMRLIVNASRDAVDALDHVINTGLGGFIVKAGIFVISATSMFIIVGKIVDSFKALSIVMETNVVAGASVIATKKLIGSTALSTGNVLKSLGTTLSATAISMWEFVTAGTVASSLFLMLAPIVAAFGVLLAISVNSTDRFKTAMSEAIEKAANFSTLITSMVEYNKKVKDMAEGSEELKQANIGLRTELFKAAEGNWEIAASATAAAMSIDPLTGKIDGTSEALKNYSKELNNLKFNNLVIAANNATEEIKRPLEGYEKVLNKLKQLNASFKAAAKNDMASDSAGVLGSHDSAGNTTTDQHDAYSAQATKFENASERMKKAAAIKETLENNKIDWQKYDADIADIVSRGASGMSDAEKKLVKDHQDGAAAAIAALDGIRMKHGLLLASSDEMYIKEARNAHMSEEAIAAMVHQLQLARSLQEKSNDSSAINTFIDDYKKASKDVGAFKDQYLDMREAMDKSTFTDKQVEAIVGLDAIGKALAVRLTKLRADQKARLALAGDNTVAQLEANDLTKKEDIAANEEIKKLYQDRAASFAYTSAANVLTLKSSADAQIAVIKKMVKDNVKDQGEASLEIRKIELETYAAIQKALVETYDPKRYKALRDAAKAEQESNIAQIRKETALEENRVVKAGGNPAEVLAAGKAKETLAYTAETKRLEEQILEMYTLQDNILRDKGEKSAEYREISEDIRKQEILISNSMQKQYSDETQAIQAKNKIKLQELETGEKLYRQSLNPVLEKDRNKSAEIIADLDLEKVKVQAEVTQEQEKAEKLIAINKKIQDEKIRQKDNELAISKERMVDIDFMEKQNIPIDQGGEATKEMVLYIGELKRKQTTEIMTLESQAAALRRGDTAQEIEGMKTMQNLRLTEMQNIEKKKATQKTESIENIRNTSEQRLAKIDTDKIDAQMYGNELQRAERLRELNRQAGIEKLAQKAAEVSLATKSVTDAEGIQTDGSMAQDNIKNEAVKRAKQELITVQKAYYSQVHQLKQEELSDDRDVAQKELEIAEWLWKNKQGSVERYVAAVDRLNKLGVINDRKANDLKIEANGDAYDSMALGARRAFAAIESDSKFMADLTTKVIDQFAGGFADAFTSFVNGSKTAKEAFLDFARSTLDMIIKMITQQLILNAVKAAFGGSGSMMSTGGQDMTNMGLSAAEMAVMKLADGGPVTGYSPHSKADNIHIMGTAGEFMHPVAAVKKYGISFMESIRTLQFPSDLSDALTNITLTSSPSSYRLAEGGIVPRDPAVNNFQGGDTKLKIVNLIDKGLMGDYMKTHEGETAFVNMIRRNGAVIRAVL